MYNHQMKKLGEHHSQSIGAVDLRAPLWERFRSCTADGGDMKSRAAMGAASSASTSASPGSSGGSSGSASDSSRFKSNDGRG